MSSDEEDCASSDEKPSSSNVAINIASAVLFGNIDNNGFLTDDIFDDECKRHLGSLQPHLGSVVPYEDIIDNKQMTNDSENSESDSDTGNDNQNVDNNKRNNRKIGTSGDNCEFMFRLFLF